MGEVGEGINAEIAKKVVATPTLGKREYQFGTDTVEVNFVRFGGEQNLKFNPEKAAFLLTGWPMRADAKITWGQPEILAKEFGMTTYEIDGRPKGHFQGNSIALEVEGIRQFAAQLEQTGVNEVTLFGHSIGASKAIDLAVALQQTNPNLKTNVVLINPVGLYAQNFMDVARNYMAEGSVEKRIRNPNRVFQPHLQVLVDLCASIFKDIKATKLRYPKLFADQRRALTELNSNLARVKSPVLLMIASDDPVSPPERLFPQEEIDKITPPAKPNEDSVDRMVRVRKVREQYLKENLLPNASDVRVIVATKYANHIAFGVERPRPSSHIIARHFDRLRR